VAEAGIVKTSVSHFVIALFAFASGIPAASAENAGPAQPAQQSQVTANETQHVGDWLVRCFPVKGQIPCDMIYILAVKKSGDMLLSVRFAYAPVENKNLFQIGVPLGVSFAKGIVISSNAGASQPLPFVHCDRSGCFVESAMDNASMDTLANAPGGAKIRFFSYNGRAFTLPFPLNGFSKAREAMDQLAKSRVGGKSAK
jgi:invasion protein IalB